MNWKGFGREREAIHYKGICKYLAKFVTLFAIIPGMYPLRKSGYVCTVTLQLTYQHFSQSRHVVVGDDRMLRSAKREFLACFPYFEKMK
jgi:hypothetical protein